MTIQADEPIKGVATNQDDTRDLIYSLDGKPLRIPIEITDSFRFTKRSMYDDEPVKKSFFSKLIGIFKVQ